MWTLILLILVVALMLLNNFNTAHIPPIDNRQRLEASATKTADFNGTAYDFGTGHAPGGAGQPMSVVISASALDFASTDETYDFYVEESADNSTWVTISPPVRFTATGVKAIPVFVSRRYLRCRLDVSGTTPSATYEAWVTALQQ